MRNFVQIGDVITAIAPVGDVKSGDGVLLGAIFGVAATDAVAGAAVELAVAGVFDLPKAAGVIAFGAPVYWDATAKAVVAADTADAMIGVCVLAAAADGLTCRVRLGAAAVVAGP